ncbi:MAG: DUF11 domain-containing protein, partial [Cyclobacteriaceae bacterium]|nr:DUF11 domain-containing protein [Cyclobacteriaceae bacterium]
GGTEPFTYLWSDGSTDAELTAVAGTYSVTITDANDCEVIVSDIVIGQPDELENPISGGDQIACAQDPIQTLIATATSPDGVDIVWFDALTGGSVVTNPVLNTVGTVTFFAEAQNVDGCTSPERTAVTLTIQPAITNNTIEEDQTILFNETPALLTGTAPSGGDGDYIYQWQRSIDGDPFEDIVGADAEDFQPGVLIQTTSFRRIVRSSDCGESISNVVVITVNDQVDLEIVKTVNNPTPNVGDNITFTLTVTNDGPNDATGVTVTDVIQTGFDYVNDGGGTSTVFQTGTNELEWTIGDLASGDNVTLDITVTVLEVGIYENTAEVEGNEFDPDLDNNSSTVTVVPAAQPALELTKSGTYVDTNGDGIVNPGDQITYTFAVENTGNVSIDGISLSDPLPGVTVSGGPIGTLEAGATDNTTFTATYTITQADIDAGEVNNTATVSGTDVFGGTTVTAAGSETVELDQEAALTVAKSATQINGETATTTFNAVGDVITYEIVVTNSGNVTLTNVEVVDPLTGLTETIASLAPGVSETITTTYTVDQDDLNAGQVDNTATATDSDDTSVTADASVTVFADQDAELTVAKSATQINGETATTT